MISALLRVLIVHCVTHFLCHVKINNRRTKTDLIVCVLTHLVGIYAIVIMYQCCDVTTVMGRLNVIDYVRSIMERVHAIQNDG